MHHNRQTTTLKKRSIAWAAVLCAAAFAVSPATAGDGVTSSQQAELEYSNRDVIEVAPRSYVRLPVYLLQIDYRDIEFQSHWETVYWTFDFYDALGVFDQAWKAKNHGVLNQYYPHANHEYFAWDVRMVEKWTYLYLP